MFGQTNEFVERYGDLGEDEFADRGGTIPQRLLMMNGDLVKERTQQNPGHRAATRIAMLAGKPDKQVETAYLAILTRRPTAEAKLAHFVARLDRSRRRRQPRHAARTGRFVLDAGQQHGVFVEPLTATRNDQRPAMTNAYLVESCAWSGYAYDDVDTLDAPASGTSRRTSRVGLVGHRLADAGGRAAGPSGGGCAEGHSRPSRHRALDGRAARANSKRSIRIPARRSPPARRRSRRPSRACRLPTACRRSPSRWTRSRSSARWSARKATTSGPRYNVKTGYRPDPTVVHPSLGAIVCHQTQRTTSRFRGTSRSCPASGPARGGFLGDQYDAFKTYDPAARCPT